MADIVDTLQQTTGIFTTDERLHVRTWDAWLARVTGIPARAAQGQPLWVLVPDLERRGLLARFQRVLADGAVTVLAPAFHQHLIRCPPQTSVRHFDAMQQRVTIGPLRDGERISGTIVTIEDVTERRERERDLAADLASPDEPTRLRATQVLAQEEARATPALFDVLSDPSWRVRQTAVGGLAQHGDAEIVAALVRALHDDHQNPSVLNSALQVLTQTQAQVLPALLALLESSDADLRGYIALALGERGDPQAIPALLATLDDNDVNVRYHVIEALGKLRARDAAAALAAIAETRDFFLAFPALDALTQIGDPAVAAQMALLLDDALLAAPVADLLGRIGDVAAVAPLSHALDHADAPVGAIVGALAALYRRATTPEALARTVGAAITATGARCLLAALSTAAADELPALVLVLGWLPGAASQQALVRLLADPTLRGEVTEALVRHGGQVVALLIALLAADDLETREAAVIALGRLGSPQAVPQLLHTLTHDDDLAIVAAGALAKIGDRRAFEPLLGMLGHSSAAVRQAVVGALNSIGHPDMAARIVLYLHDVHPHVRESAVKIAGYFGYPECVEALLVCCRDADLGVRRAAITHIPFVEDRRIVPTLAQALHDDAPQIRAAAARALGQVDDPRATTLLAAALNDADVWVRYYAARALGRQVATEATDALITLAQTDPAPHVRITAIDALGQIGGARAASALAPLAALSNDELAFPALRALAQTAQPTALADVRAALHSARAARRVAAVEALAGAPLAQALETLRTALDDSEAAVRRAAIVALQRAEDATVQQRLAALAQSDPDPDVRAAAHTARQRGR